MQEKNGPAPVVEEQERYECPKLILKGCGRSWVRHLDPEWNEEQLRAFIMKIWDLMDQLFEEQSQR